jgi:hypothetical protein
MSAAAPSCNPASVVMLADLDRREVEWLVESFGGRLAEVVQGAEIPGSYWKDAEAGLVGATLYVRADTPAHSLLHELCHYICMDDARRATLSTDAGGTDDEECAVCYLQIALSDRLSGFGSERCLRDMDTWGYSFREGSARAWLAGDAVHARAWLRAHGLIDASGAPTGRLRITGCGGPTAVDSVDSPQGHTQGARTKTAR